MFYDIFKQLCQEKGISCNRAALEIGLSNAAVPKWKKTGAIPKGETLNRIATYFGVSRDYLLTGEADPPLRYSNRDELKFALFGGREDISDEMLEEVQRFADYLLQREDACRE